MAVALDILTNPPSQPYRFGLFSAATVIDDPAFEPRGGDYTWRVQGCTPGAQWDYCWTDGAPGQDPKSVTRDAWLDGSPFVVYDGVRCDAVGEPDLKTVATARLALSEQGQAERRQWAQLAAAATAEGSAAVLYPADDPAPTLTDAIAALEAQLAATTGAIGILHAPRALAIHFDRYGELTRDGSTLRTPLWTPLAFGGGYNYTGPDGTVTDGVAWIYATGPTVVRRGPVIVPDQNGVYFDRASNTIRYIAERPYLITNDCPVYAAAVTVESLPATVWPNPPATFAMTVDATDLSAVKATFTNASCDQVRIAWGDGATEGATVTGGAATATHNYLPDENSSTRAATAPTTNTPRKKKGR